MIVAECCECGTEISFDTDEQFAELVDNHACTSLV